MEYDGGSLKSGNIHYLDFSKNKNQILPTTKGSSNNKYNSIENEVVNIKPQVPVHFIRPNAINKAANWFLNNFPGQILYSVKSNPDRVVLSNLYQSGIRQFDVASLAEIKLIAELFPTAPMYFMHPIKSRESIYEAYFNYNIRDFSLDSSDELKKILEVTNNAKDLSLHVRLAIPNNHAAIDLSGKFGILPSEAVSLVRKCRTVAKKLGICFHVGSQCMDPTQYRNALTIAKEVVVKAKIKLDIIDVGGGFPSSYPGLVPCALSKYVDEISDSIKSLGFSGCQVLCEPGRALVAESGSLLVRVEAKKNKMLYINDGTYGGLFDAGHPGFIYPARTIRIKNSEPLSLNLMPFGFYGPTCDSLDTMKGPFYLPDNICEGDYIEIGQLGAYSRSLRTDFNGFNANLQIEVNDEPLVSMYNEEEIEEIAALALS